MSAQHRRVGPGGSSTGPFSFLAKIVGYRQVSRIRERSNRGTGVPHSATDGFCQPGSGPISVSLSFCLNRVFGRPRAKPGGSPFLRAPGAAGRCFAPAPRFAPHGPPEWLAQTTTPGLIARAFQISSLGRDDPSPVQMIRLRRSQTKRRGAPATEASGSMSPIPLGAEWEPWDVDDLVRGGREPWVSMALHDGS